jgi:hypothetical protein
VSGLEPDGLAAPGADDQAAAIYSMAISLKRIADALNRDQPSREAIYRVLLGAADPAGFGDFRNATELGLEASRLARLIDGRKN